MLHIKNGKRQALSLEMFETDVQLVMNEYLKNLTQEKNFIKQGFEITTDYKPIAEYSCLQGINVIAANTPDRYVNLVSP